MATQQFFVMIKPDGVKRGLIGKIISRFEKRGFCLVWMKLASPPRELFEEQYKEYAGKTFYDELINFSVSGPVVLMIWSGNIQVARSLIGDTIPWETKPGTIRGDYASSLPSNLVHCSADQQNANREVEHWTINLD